MVMTELNLIFLLTIIQKKVQSKDTIMTVLL